jgi:hypothetical protein
MQKNRKISHDPLLPHTKQTKKNLPLIPLLTEYAYTHDQACPQQ